MKRKLAIIVAAVLITIMLLPEATSAYYSNVIGQARDSKTGSPWVHGGSVEVFNCNTLANIANGSLDSNGQFDISLGSYTGPDRPLCIEITFNNGGNGTPGNASKGPFADRSGSTGTLDTGVYFTGTGPTVVTMSDVRVSTSTSRAGLPFAAAAGLAALAAGAAILRRRRDS